MSGKSDQGRKELLRLLPKIDLLVPHLGEEAPKGLRVRACRQVVDSLRTKILSGHLDATEPLSLDHVVELARRRLEELLSPSLRRVVNATGVVVHTNLGRSLLPESVIRHMEETARNYSNLEYDLAKGERGSRYSHVEEILCELTGAEAALVVNNNAGAVLITLGTLAAGREVVVSRGELVEIGGSFRIPDVMARSGAILREVGATNRTHLRDYEAAICDETALLMKVHQSNFQVVGFTKSVSVSELAALGRERGLPVYEDLGSGNLVDFGRYGLIHEPTVQESIAAGADVVSFSGDKLLGGPQAGIIVGRRSLLDKIKKNPLNRALRIDKLTLASLEALLHIYREPDRAVQEIPTLRMLLADVEGIRRSALSLARGIRRLGLEGLEVDVEPCISRVGGGALPLQELKSWAVVLGHPMGAAELEKRLRHHSPPVIVRVENDRVVMDVRTLQDGERSIVIGALEAALV